MSELIDTRGLSCPQPVLLFLNALKGGAASSFSVLVDNDASLENVSFKGPFTGIRFCPTGGITVDNLLSFLRLPNVACVGGTWIAPDNLIRARAWDQITQPPKGSFRGTPSNVTSARPAPDGAMALSDNPCVVDPGAVGRH